MRKNSLPFLCKAALTLLMPVLLLITIQSSAVELNVARQGEVKNVPVQQPYNGCLIVREGPGMEYPVKGHVVNGDTVTIEGASGSWYRISAPIAGYIWSSYIAVTDSQTVDTANMTKPLDLETIVNNADPLAREQNLPARQQLLEDNRVIEINIDQEIQP
ncbi:MAG: SH3 domain-containing protein [Candidatus Riflebacteria bacterium]|nr:SH3 domain-containing protein [Candidatus Riflebacteria bacterium]